MQCVWYHGAAAGTLRQRAGMEHLDRLLELTYRAERTHFWFRGFRRFVGPWLARAAGGRTDLRLLDCGCGTGNNLRLLERHGRAFGFDITAVGPRFARAHGLTKVARGSIGDIPCADASFDIVTSFDVLYGLPDDLERAAVREMARVARPGGHVLITVAALESLRGGHGSLAKELRRYDTAVKAIRALGIRSVRLLTNNPLKLDALAEAGVPVVGREAVFTGLNSVNEGYLETKRVRMGHLYSQVKAAG